MRITSDREQPRCGSLQAHRVGRERRHRDDARQGAREQRQREVDARRVEEQATCTREPARLQARRDRGRSADDLIEC